jgi:transposase
MATERRTRIWWQAAVARWKRSGLSAREFAEREDVSARTLAWWSSTLRRATRVSRGQSQLVPLAPIEIEVPRIANTISRISHVEIAVSGVIVRVEVGTDVHYVGALVAALGVRT